MPIFEYHCESCQNDFEELIRGSEQPNCPKCGTDRVEKLFSAPAAPSSGHSLPMSGACPPPSAHPCGPGCCRAH